MDDFTWKDPLLTLDQLSEDERLIQRSAAQFTEKKLAPYLSSAFTENGLARQGYEAIGNAGLFGVTLPQEYGGASASYISYGLIAREVERLDSGFRFWNDGFC